MSTATEATRVLRRFKNAILEGPPGTGKTHVVKTIADGWKAVTGRPLVGDGSGRFAITFHPSTTYEEFVEGLRYDDRLGKFVRRDGFLRLIIDEAGKRPDADFLVLLDEVNRANIPKVLGDVLLCMESTKRSTFDGSGWIGGQEVTLPYSGDLFSIPDNIYLLGTMNTSDRSIAPLDSALRRRFGFVRVDPIVGNALSEAIEDVDGSDARRRMASSVEALTTLNSALRECLGPDAMLGHSYMFGAEPLAGPTSLTSDPLGAVRDLIKRFGGSDAFWLESTAKPSGGSATQLNIPDSGGHGSLRTRFYPMSSNGKVTNTPAAGSAKDYIDLHIEGQTFVGNTLHFNPGGPNYKLGFAGLNSAQQPFSRAMPTGYILDKVHVFVRRPDSTFDMLSLPRDAATLTALKSVSTAPDGWHDSTRGAGGRSYGVINLTDLSSTQPAHARSDDEDAVWMVWRYAVLPQLIETLTQLGYPDLLDPAAREVALENLQRADLADKFAKVDDFLAEQSLYLTLEGHGLSRGIAISEAPVRVTTSTGVDAADAQGVAVDQAETDEDDED